MDVHFVVNRWLSAFALVNELACGGMYTARIITTVNSLGKYEGLYISVPDIQNHLTILVNSAPVTIYVNTKATGFAMTRVSMKKVACLLNNSVGIIKFS